MATIFPTAQDLGNNVSTLASSINEINIIQGLMLTASANGLVDVTVTNSNYTSTNLGTYTNIGSVNLGSSSFTLTGHGFITGQEVQLTTTGTLPAPIVTALNYWTIVLDANTFQLASTVENAFDSIPLVLTTVGNGTQQIKPVTLSEQYFQVWQGLSIDRSKQNQMNQVISYFENLGYQIMRQTNPSTNVTFQWIVSW